jgi:hypothetical protein
MTNPLDRATPALVGGNGFQDMAVGETRTASFPSRYDEKGKPDPTSIKTYTMTRTSRPFIYDWVDCVSNVALDRKERYDIRWVAVNEEEAQLLPAREAARLRSLRHD